MAARLEQRGIAIDVEPLLAEAERRSVGRPDLARAMVAAGAASARSRTRSRATSTTAARSTSRTARCRSTRRSRSAAPPAPRCRSRTRTSTTTRGAALLRRHQADGLTGIEAFYGAYDPRERARWIALADELGLVCTGGSDWHGPAEALAPPGVDLPADRSAALLAWLGG